LGIAIAICSSRDIFSRALVLPAFATDHDFGGFYDGRCFFTPLQVQLIDGISSDDGCKLLVPYA
jgi:hypothetical protein